jgi:HAD superfamily hydrolase (TIGR01509 family)
VVAIGFIFDLDGVLIDSKEIHFSTLNQALSQVAPEFVISIKSHLDAFEGLSTKTKLDKLTLEYGLPINLHQAIWELKQKLTQVEFSKVKLDQELISIFKFLKDSHISTAVASNSIQKTVESSIINLGISQYTDLFVGNESVSRPKPFPEIYRLVMEKLNLHSYNSFIFEDSKIGIESAKQSGAYVFEVSNRSTLNLNLIESLASDIIKGKPNKQFKKKQKMNVLIPMSGEGSRFKQAGYTFPKPLIEVNGKAMIQLVVENLGIEAHYVFVVRESHAAEYNLNSMFENIVDDFSIVRVENPTEGAACTSLLAQKYIDSPDPLVIANSDQFVESGISDGINYFIENDFDGGLLSFESSHPKWSYARVDKENNVFEVAEKKVISNKATVGIYFWKRGSDFVKYAHKMIQQNERVNNEFYICPVFNLAIKDGLRIGAFDVTGMWGLGTPEDLRTFLSR